jgi:hypothetical protein
MPLDETKIGIVAANLMEQLDSTYGDGDDATIEHVMIIAAVDRPGADTVHFAASEGVANYEGIGLLRTVLLKLEQS